MTDTREEMGLYLLSRVDETTHSLIPNGMMGGGAYGPLERGAMRISPTKGKVEDGTVWLDEHWTLADKDSSHHRRRHPRSTTWSGTAAACPPSQAALIGDRT
ncbi:hypothetical protein ACFCW6_36795 [Streptomyces sp. NPDC056333]|uniref:hypothetical protein n=1 Tax=Streptomyces sp. NPDC056333 TaxID=3345786 RepID=UPI0035D62112